MFWAAHVAALWRAWSPASIERAMVSRAAPRISVVVTYNPCSLTEPARELEISRRLRHADLLFLTGIGRKAPRDLPSWRVPHRHHWALHRGWEPRQPFANKSAGVAILLNVHIFRLAQMVYVDIGPVEFGGRVLATRFKSPRHNLFLCAMYWPARSPPPPTGISSAACAPGWTATWRPCRADASPSWAWTSMTRWGVVSRRA